MIFLLNRLYFILFVKPNFFLTYNINNYKNKYRKVTHTFNEFITLKINTYECKQKLVKDNDECGSKFK